MASAVLCLRGGSCVLILRLSSSIARSRWSRRRITFTASCMVMIDTRLVNALMTRISFKMLSSAASSDLIISSGALPCLLLTRLHASRTVLSGLFDSATTCVCTMPLLCIESTSTYCEPPHTRTHLREHHVFHPNDGSEANGYPIPTAQINFPTFAHRSNSICTGREPCIIASGGRSVTVPKYHRIPRAILCNKFFFRGP